MARIHIIERRRAANLEGAGGRRPGGAGDRRHAYRADWSPAGNRTAYWGNEGIKIADSETASVLVRIPFPNSLPTWSPDGTRIAAIQVGNPTSVVVFDICMSPR